jgi:hypothetical protein
MGAHDRPRRKHRAPAPHDLGIVPLRRQTGIDGDHQVQVVGHDGVGMDGDGELVGEPVDAVPQPLTAVLEAQVGLGIDTAQEGATRAARHAVAEPWGVRIDEVGARVAHGKQHAAGAGSGVQESADGGCWKREKVGCPVLCQIAATRRGEPNGLRTHFVGLHQYSLLLVAPSKWIVSWVLFRRYSRTSYLPT